MEGPTVILQLKTNAIDCAAAKNILLNWQTFSLAEGWWLSCDERRHQLIR
jgi:hypothetical protein